ncbi:MAG: fimbria/pilus periplasmic chaperone [Deferrisomatales bacterium]|nr:fimbria/pilus periplasmic chaperone [Deferrisomatales bacterium]
MVRRNARVWHGTVFCWLLTGALSPAAAAEGGVGGLLIAPTRVVVEARQRSAELTLMNRGSRTEAYRLEVVEKRMADDGRLEDLPQGETAPHSAAAMLRYSPRQVTLAPGETQKVRLMVRRPADLVAGEYRSHLMIRTLPPPGEPPATEADLGDGQLSVKLITTTAVTIPLIVRHGETHVEMALTDLAWVAPAADAGAPRLGFRLTRAGTRSAYGDVTVEWEPAAGGAPVTLGTMRGVAVYAPNRSRRVEIPLTADPVQRVAGVVRVTYRSPDGSSRSFLAESSLALN